MRVNLFSLKLVSEWRIFLHTHTHTSVNTCRDAPMGGKAEPRSDERARPAPVCFRMHERTSASPLSDIDDHDASTCPSSQT